MKINIPTIVSLNKQSLQKKQHIDTIPPQKRQINPNINNNNQHSPSKRSSTPQQQSYINTVSSKEAAYGSEAEGAEEDGRPHRQKERPREGDCD
jgi:hypothetical protein